MAGKLLAHLRQQWLGALALLLVLTGGTAYALDGSNTVFSDDIVNGEVRSGDIGDFEVKAADVAPDSLGGAKIADRSVKNADLSTGASSSNTIADGGIQGVDVKNDTLTGSQVDESTLFYDNSLTGADVADDSLTGTDVQESSLLGVNADKVDGGDLCRTGGVVTITETDFATIHRVCDQGALRVEAVCGVISEKAVTANLRLDTSVDDSFYGVRGESASQDGDFDAADGIVALTSAVDDSVEDPGFASQLASFYAGTPAGAQLSGTAGTRATLNGDGSGTCDFVVGAIG